MLIARSKFTTIIASMALAIFCSTTVCGQDSAPPPPSPPSPPFSPPLKNSANYIIGGPPTKYIWSFGLDTVRYRLKSTDQFEIVGTGARVRAGYSYFLNSNWMAQGQLAIYAGPWNKILYNSFDGDFSGMGFTGEIIHPLSGAELRSGESMFMGVASFAYSDVTGKSIGKNHHITNVPDDNSNSYREKNYTIKVQSAMLETSIQYGSFMKPRPSGNTTDLLTTRVEGKAVRFGVGLPLFSKYRAFIIQRENSPTAPQEPVESIHKGLFRGFYFVLGGEIWLGS